MNRRHFLATLIASAAAATLDPEKLLWIPGAKTVFIPEKPQLLQYGMGWIEYIPFDEFKRRYPRKLRFPDCFVTLKQEMRDGILHRNMVAPRSAPFLID